MGLSSAQSWFVTELFPFTQNQYIRVQNCNGRDGSILLGELAQIITAMRNRAIQPRVDENGEELLPRQLEFEKEERFLSLAYLGANLSYSIRF